MRVRMERDQVVPDGPAVGAYAAGGTYNVPAGLAHAWAAAGAAVLQPDAMHHGLPGPIPLPPPPNHEAGGEAAMKARNPHEPSPDLHEDTNAAPAQTTTQVSAQGKDLDGSPENKALPGARESKPRKGPSRK